MARMGNFDMRGLEQFRDNLKKLQDPDMFVQECAKELAARLMRSVVKRTPVDSGNLRRGWFTGEIKKSGNSYIIEVSNPVDYASYVEYGHRTATHNGWVKGRFMMTITEEEIRKSTQGILEKKIYNYLRSAFKNG